MANKYQAQAEHTAKIIAHVMANERGLQPPTSYYLTEAASGNVWLFAVMDERNLGGAINPYIDKQLLHQLKTALNGHPVVLSNTTGLRYAVLMNSRRQLPQQLDFPGCDYAGLLLGITARFTELRTNWDTLGHTLVAGMTGSGKSNFLRLLALQAISDKEKVIFIDAQDRTFPKLAAQPGILYHARNLAEAETAITTAMSVYEERVALFKATPTLPDDLQAYNMQQPTPLPRVIVFIEEFTGLVKYLGNKSPAYTALARLSWEARKYGIYIVAAGQTWDKLIAGEMRDQFTSRFTFKVANASQSRVAINKAGAEQITQPGVCLFQIGATAGKLKTYYLPTQAMLTTKLVAADEKELLQAAAAYNNGKVDLAFIMQHYSISQAKAQRIASQLEARGWLEKDVDRNNARFITQAAAGLLGINR